MLSHERNPDRIREIASKVSAAQLPVEEQAKPNSDKRRKRRRDGIYVSVASRIEQARCYIEERDLSLSQLVAAKKVFAYFSDVATYKDSSGSANITLEELHAKNIMAPHLILTGHPGSGKSYATETTCELAVRLDLGVVGTTSYNGIATVNVDGSTVCSMFRIFDTADGSDALTLDPRAIKVIADKINADNLCFLIIDEVSTIDTRIIAMLDMRLQQIRANTLPFGGLPIMFAGDFNQLGPVQKTFIPKDMMTWALRLQKAGRLDNPPPPSSTTTDESIPAAAASKRDRAKNFAAYKTGRYQATQKRKKAKQEALRFKPSSLAYKGCLLFSKFLRFHLSQQKRSTDPNHNRFVRKLSLGHAIDLEDILQYKSLSSDDICNEPELWKFAPILVGTNKERLNIARHKARLWALEHNTYVFKWRNRLRKEENRPPPSGHGAHHGGQCLLLAMLGRSCCSLQPFSQHQRGGCTRQRGSHPDAFLDLLGSQRAQSHQISDGGERCPPFWN